MSPACLEFLPSSNPRIRTCCRCGRPEGHHPAAEPPQAPSPQRSDVRLRARNHALEAELVDTAARAAGFFDTQGNGDDGGLSRFADARAWPGGVRADLDGVREASEEFADARNYLVWEIERIYARVIEGERDALDRYSQLFGALSALVNAWHALHRVPS